MCQKGSLDSCKKRPWQGTAERKHLCQCCGLTLAALLGFYVCSHGIDKTWCGARSRCSHDPCQQLQVASAAKGFVSSRALPGVTPRRQLHPVQQLQPGSAVERRPCYDCPVAAAPPDGATCGIDSGGVHHTRARLTGHQVKRTR
eukprot:352209-Chlamydomonas_euryale.AAC.8